MARYIDADELRYKVKTETNPYGEPTLEYESGVKVLAMIDNAPKSEVAREIFEEIKRLYATKVIMDGEVVYDTTERFNAVRKKYTEEK